MCAAALYEIENLRAILSVALLGTALACVHITTADEAFKPGSVSVKILGNAYSQVAPECSLFSTLQRSGLQSGRGQCPQVCVAYCLTVVWPPAASRLTVPVPISNGCYATDRRVVLRVNNQS
jgi:hypothetical protein